MLTVRPNGRLAWHYFVESLGTLGEGANARAAVSRVGTNGENEWMQTIVNKSMSVYDVVNQLLSQHTAWVRGKKRETHAARYAPVVELRFVCY